MSYQGMDPEVLRRVAQQLRVRAAELDSVVAQVQHSVESALVEWEGEDAFVFEGWWGDQHRPALVAAHEALVGLAQSLDNNVVEQEGVSGGGTAASGTSQTGSYVGPSDEFNPKDMVGVAGLATTTIGWFGSRFLPRAADGRWVAPSSLSEVERQLAAVTKDSNYLPGVGSGWKWLGRFDKSLGVVGAVTDAVDVRDGLTQNDAGKTTTGGIGLGTSILTVSTKLPPPLAVASAAALTYGEITLPTDNEGYEGTLELAMSRQFGSAYDPANPTSEQAQWAVDHYAGFGGFLNSISDGMDYKWEDNTAKLGKLWGGATGWLR